MVCASGGSELSVLSVMFWHMEGATHGNASGPEAKSEERWGGEVSVIK